MAVKIRLQRHGKKSKPFFHIVAADSRSPRDGKYIERLGSYNPNTNPATIVLDNEKAIQWLRNGAQPTDTARAILSYRGVLYRQHLITGVAKGALSQEDADNRYETWMTEKEGKVQAKRDSLSGSKEETTRKALKQEREVNEKRIQTLAAAAAVKAEKEESAPADKALVVETPTGETPVAETSDAETQVAETPVAEAPVAEAPVVETPDAETPAAETPAAESTEA
ncbi:MAG: 30S ribosomal protein S16 [Flavobacteriales bacterium]|nr:30S ribosomal protein S16 [Flavobacteriales bacterium]